MQYGFFHECVRVPAGDEIDPADLRGHLGIANLAVFRIRVITEVRHANNQLALFLLAQQTHHAATHLHRIEVLNTFEIFGCNQIVRTDSHPKKSDAHIPKRAHSVRLHACFQRRAAKIVIGRDEIKVRKLHR